jgi:anti-anti-sigma factor
MQGDSSATDAGFEVTVVERAGRLYLLVTGDLDLAAKDRFLEVFEGLRPLPAPVVVDLSEVGFMDSSGLRCLLTVDEAVRAESVGPVQLVGVRPAVRRTLEVSGTREIFTIS